MDESNPYAPPAAPIAVGAAGLPQLVSAPLFRISGIGVAAAFGTVLAGGVLMAMNYRALGQPERTWPTLILSLVAWLLVMLLAFVLPEQVPNIAFTAVQLFAMIWAARHYQGTAIDARTAAALPMRSNWAAFGIALLVLAGIALCVGLTLAAFLGWSGLSWDEFVRDVAARSASMPLRAT